MTQGEAWRTVLERLREAAARPSRGAAGALFEPSLEAQLGTEAVMTLVSIMQDDNDPKLQISAAKALLQRSRTAYAGACVPENTVAEMTPDECDAAIAVAKALLDELASRKAAGVSRAGELGSEGKA